MGAGHATYSMNMVLSRVTRQGIWVAAITVVTSLLPGSANAVFFPLQTVLRTLHSPHVHRAVEDVSRAPRGYVAGLPVVLPDYLPALQWVSTEELEKQWAEAKDLKKPKLQLKRVKKRNLRNLLSYEMRPLPSIGPKYVAAVERRDTFRERHFASPELYSLLEEAIPKLKERLPNATVMVGDVSQPGAGPLVYGTTVRMLQNTPLRPALSDFLGEAFRDGNSLIRSRVVSPMVEFPSEDNRWKEIEGPIWVEEKLTGGGDLKGVPVARVEMRRFYRSGELEKDELAKWWKKKKRNLKKRYQMESGWVTRGTQKLWRVQWNRGNFWYQGEFTKKFRNTPVLKHLSRLKMGRLEKKKPGALQQERRYFITKLPDGGSKLIAWRQLYEAGHISHLNGRDADLSYVMKKPSLLFSRSVGHIDVKKTRVWFEILFDSAQAVGVQIDAMLVDRRVKRRLLRGMPKDEDRHPVWDLLSVSKGHDSHVHVRLSPGFYLGSRNAFRSP